MLTYRVRQRYFKLSSDSDKLAFPNECIIRFHLQPKQQFGTANTGGRTVVQHDDGDLCFDQNTGKMWAVNNRALSPLAVATEHQGKFFEIQGDTVQLRIEASSLAELEQSINYHYFSLPLFLNLELADPPKITRVEGMVADVPFAWELDGWFYRYHVTNQEAQEAKIRRAWARLVDFGNYPRLLASLHYFHVAASLERHSDVPGEYLSESLLNYAKILEVLWPPHGDGLPRDAVRRGLALLHYTNEEIEGQFMPAMAMRNEIDVAHVHLSVFTLHQLEVLQSYADAAENHFREMLDRVTQALSLDCEFVEKTEFSPPSKDSLKVLQRLEKQAEKSVQHDGASDGS